MKQSILTKEQKIQQHQRSIGIQTENIKEQLSASINYFQKLDPLLLPRDWALRYWWPQEDFKDSRKSKTKSLIAMRDQAAWLFLNKDVIDQIESIRNKYRIDLKRFHRLRVRFYEANKNRSDKKEKYKKQFKNYFSKIPVRKINQFIELYGLSPTFRDSIVEFILTDKCSMPERNSYWFDKSSFCLYLYGDCSRRLFSKSKEDQTITETKNGGMKYHSPFSRIQMFLKQNAPKIKDPQSASHVTQDVDNYGFKCVKVRLGSNSTQKHIVRKPRWPIIKKYLKALPQQRLIEKPQLKCHKEIVNLHRQGKSQKEIQEIVSSIKTTRKGKGGPVNYDLVRKVLSNYGWIKTLSR